MRKTKAHSIPNAVEATGQSRSQLYVAIKSGKLKARKAGRRTLILDEDLDEYLANLPMFSGRD